MKNAIMKDSIKTIAAVVGLLCVLCLLIAAVLYSSDQPAVQQPSIVYDCEQTIVSAELLPNHLNLYGVVCTGKPDLKYFLVSQVLYAIGQTIGIEPTEVQVIDEEYDNVQPNPLII